MNVDVLVAEVGSTTTLVTAFDGIDGSKPRIAGQGVSRTTVLEGDVTAGLRAAVRSLEEWAGERVSWGSMMASSSAAGGLKMTVHGLVYEMTARAAGEAALGAGAIVKMITAGRLTARDLESLRRVRPSIVLLAGGVDYGERDTVLYNAQAIGSLGLRVPVVYAGNAAAREEAVGILEDSGLEVIPVENVYPRIDTLNVDPARKAIQSVFEQHIVEAPGMEKIRDLIDGSVIPTPGAVMNAALLLYRDIGDLIAVDIGGATTDVHSVTEGSQEIRGILAAPEPLAKRTVEGDLGVFINAENVAERIGWKDLNESLGLDARTTIADMIRKKHVVPATPGEESLVGRLAQECAAVAVERHAGRVRSLYGRGARAEIAEGRDLTSVKWIIGTGGVLSRLSRSREVLERAVSQRPPTASTRLLMPSNPEVLIDSQYIMSASGVLSIRWPQAAVDLMKQSLRPPRGCHYPLASSPYHIT